VPSCAECLALGKGLFAERLSLPSAALGKVGFAECPIKSTRQSRRHSAKSRIPVVISSKLTTETAYEYPVRANLETSFSQRIFIFQRKNELISLRKMKIPYKN
jgi:hypothetical protein